MHILTTYILSCMWRRQCCSKVGFASVVTLALADPCVSSPHSLQQHCILPLPLLVPRPQDVWLTAADSTKLHAWLLTPRGWSKQQLKERPVMMFFQVRTPFPQ